MTFIVTFELTRNEYIFLARITQEEKYSIDIMSTKGSLSLIQSTTGEYECSLEEQCSKRIAYNKKNNYYYEEWLEGPDLSLRNHKFALVFSRTRLAVVTKITIIFLNIFYGLHHIFVMINQKKPYVNKRMNGI
jgi:hypothetical protein